MSLQLGRVLTNVTLEDREDLSRYTRRSIEPGRHPRRTKMLRKFTLGLFAAAALTTMALVPTDASARGSGWSGSGGGRGVHDHQRSQGLGTRFIGPAVQKDSHRHKHWHGFGIGYFGGGYVVPSYASYRYLDESCYVVRRVPTPYGYRLRAINICRY